MLLQEMTWSEISNLSRDIPVVVPVAINTNIMRSSRSRPESLAEEGNIAIRAQTLLELRNPTLRRG